MPSGLRTTRRTAFRGRSGPRTGRAPCGWPGRSRPASSPSTRIRPSGFRRPSAGSSSPGSGGNLGCTRSMGIRSSRTSISRRSRSVGRLDGKVAVITGAASGIGREAALLFSEEGASVCVADVSDEQGEQTAAECREAVFHRVDVADSASVEAMYAAVAEHYGGIDVLYNNAGISPGDDASILETDEAAWQRVQDVNLKGVFLCCKLGIPYLLERGGGSIINVASFVAILGAATSQISYTASKGGVLSLSRELAVQFARQGVRVNALCPGPVETPLLLRIFGDDPAAYERRRVHLPMGRLAKPREIVNAALFLASDESSYVNGATFLVDGGLTAAYVTPEYQSVIPEVDDQ